MPIFFECQRCAACCRSPGQVRLREREIDAIAGHLSMNAEEFIERHTRLQPDRKGLALNEREDGSCVFLEEGRCRIQPVKPQQCRDFPNLWRDPEMIERCRAIPRTVSEAEYGKLLQAATGRPPQTRPTGLQTPAKPDPSV